MNGIERYFRYRQSLIDQYLKGDMTKREYLKANYEAVVYHDIGPFTILDRVDKCLFNYQYYNALAKASRALSGERNMEYELQKSHRKESDYYYRKKDFATKQALKLLDFKNVEAYFVTVKSHQLKGRLVEIICKNDNMYDMILHTTSEELLRMLQEEGVFQEGKRTSVIDQYINARY